MDNKVFFPEAALKRMIYYVLKKRGEARAVLGAVRSKKRIGTTACSRELAGG